jgi:hypothetical protein
MSLAYSVAGGGDWLMWHVKPEPIYEFSDSGPKTLVDACLPLDAKMRFPGSITASLIEAGVISGESCNQIK